VRPDDRRGIEARIARSASGVGTCRLWDYAVDGVRSQPGAGAALAVQPTTPSFSIWTARRDGLVLLKDMRNRGNAVFRCWCDAARCVEHRWSPDSIACATTTLIKPLRISEVIARDQALLRRPEGALGALSGAGNIDSRTIGRDRASVDSVLVLPRRESAIWNTDAPGRSASCQGGVEESRTSKTRDRLRSGPCPSSAAHAADSGANGRDPHGSGVGILWRGPDA